MHIRSGVADVVAVEAHSKTADVLDKTAVENLSLDPTMLRVPGANVDALAGLEMSGFMAATGVTRDEVSLAVRSEKKGALGNPRASYGADLEVGEISTSEPVSVPLRKYDKPEFAEGGIVLVMAGEGWLRKHRKDAVWVDAIEWRSTTPWYEQGEMGSARYAGEAFRSVLKQTRRRSLSAFDVLEIDDSYSYKLLQHLMSVGLSRKQAMALVEGEGPALNPSGGSLGTGYMIEATGLQRVLECVLQLRGTAGGNQVSGASKALAVSWRGQPTATGAAIALSGGT